MLSITGYQGKTRDTRKIPVKRPEHKTPEKKEFSFITNETINGDNLFREELAASSKV